MSIKIVNYHCRHCGAPVNPEQDICDYCNMPIHYKERAGARTIRTLIDTDNDFVYFDRIIELSSYQSEPEMIEVTTRFDTVRHYVPARPSANRLDVGMKLDDRGWELLRKLDISKRYNIRFELSNIIAYQMPIYISDFKMPDNNDSKMSLTFIADGDIKKNELELPKGITCPNCGGLLKSRYGACDYCGGWVEYLG